MRIQTVPSDSVDVLIVDDDASTRELLRLLLEQHGYRCAEARDGREALARIHEESPRCVLLDLLMPDLDGFTVARTLRAGLRSFAAHIHCLSGLQTSLVQDQARLAGCEEFLTKPVDGSVLVEIVGQAVQRYNEVPATVVSGLTREQAHDVLDWLEKHGCTGLIVTIEEDGVAVRCICPRGLRLTQDPDGDLCLAQQSVMSLPASRS